MGKKQTRNEAGFSGLMPLLLIVILAIIGFAGWYVYKANRSVSKTDDSSDSTISTSSKQPATTASPTPTSSQTPDPTASWKTYSNNAYKISIKYPADMTCVGASSVDTQFAGSSIVGCKTSDAISDGTGFRIDVSRLKDISNYPNITDIYNYTKKTWANDSTAVVNMINSNGFEGNIVARPSFEETILYRRDGTGYFSADVRAASNNKSGYNFNNLGGLMLSTFKTMQ